MITAPDIHMLHIPSRKATSVFNDKTNWTSRRYAEVKCCESPVDSMACWHDLHDLGLRSRPVLLRTWGQRHGTTGHLRVRVNQSDRLRR